MRAAEGLLDDCMLVQPKVKKPKLYNVVRNMGWLAFTAHAVSPGSASLVIQLISVVILGLSTLMLVNRVGDDDTCVALTIKATTATAGSPGPKKQQEAFVWLELTPEEEQRMIQMRCLPLKSDSTWWTEYERKKISLQLSLQRKGAASEVQVRQAAAASEKPIG